MFASRVMQQYELYVYIAFFGMHREFVLFAAARVFTILLGELLLVFKQHDLRW